MIIKSAGPKIMMKFGAGFT